MLEPFTYLSLHRFCMRVGKPADLLLPGNRILTRIGQSDERFAAPRVSVKDDAPHLRKFLGTEPRVDPDLAFATEAGVLRTGNRFVAALDDVTVQRVSQGRERCMLRLAPGVVVGETYHGIDAGRFLSKAWGETDASGVNWMDALPSAPPPWIEELPAVMLASMWEDNYAHWLLEVLPRIWYRDVCPELADLPIATGRMSQDFQRETLDALDMSCREFVVQNPATQYRRLYFPSFIAPGGYSRKQVAWLNINLRWAFDLPMAEIDPARRIYVSRDDATHRRVLNENAVTAALGAQGYTTIVPGRMTVRDQIIAFSAASEIVIPHGAAGANLVFAPPGAKVLELIPASYRHPMYWWLSQFRDLDYARLPCADQGSEKNLTVNVETMSRMLEGLRS